MSGQSVVWQFIGALATPLAVGAVWMIGVRLIREVTR